MGSLKGKRKQASSKKCMLTKKLGRDTMLTQLSATRTPLSLGRMRPTGERVGADAEGDGGVDGDGACDVEGCGHEEVFTRHDRARRNSTVASTKATDSAARQAAFAPPTGAVASSYADKLSAKASKTHAKTVKDSMQRKVKYAVEEFKQACDCAADQGLFKTEKSVQLQFAEEVLNQKEFEQQLTSELTAAIDALGFKRSTVKFAWPPSPVQQSGFAFARATVHIKAKWPGASSSAGAKRKAPDTPGTSGVSKY